MVKFLVAVLVVVVLAVVAATVAGSWLADRSRDERHAADADPAPASDAVLNSYVEDQRALADHWLFRAVDGPDASPLLRVRVPFMTADVSNPSAVGVPDAIARTLNDYRWLRNADSLDLTGLDLAWMAALPGFGFWDLEAEVKGPPDIAQFKDWSPLPEPDFKALHIAVKARLLQGLKNGDLPAAFAETRALARLCASTELYSGVAMGAGMIRIEAEFVEELRRRGALPDVEAPADRELANRLSRVLLAAPAAFQFEALRPGLEAEVVLGRCAGLGQGLISVDRLRPLLRDRYAARFAELDGLLAASPCRLRSVRAMWSARADETTKEGLQRFCRLHREHAPIVCATSGMWAGLRTPREAVGESLVTFAQPGWFSSYQRALAQAPSSAP